VSTRPRLAGALLVVVALATPAAAQPTDDDADDDLEIPAAPSDAPSDPPVTPPAADAPPPAAPAEVPPPPAVSTEPPSAAAPELVATTPAPEPLEALLDRAGLELGGYVQGQYEGSLLSEDQLMQGGALRNQDQFTVRRARLTVARQWEHAGLRIELEAGTGRSGVGVRRAEAALRWPGPAADRPWAELTAGLLDIPFGRALEESVRDRLFVERPLSSLALFPGEADVGVQASGAFRFARWYVAVQSGEVVAEMAAGRRQDPNAAKDVTVRVTAGHETARFAVIGGVSVLRGTGFHPGRDATKDAIEWRDANENGAIDTGELVPVPGTAAVPSENFDRWAVGADLALGLRTGLGWTRLEVEVTVASNLDRGLFVADPVAAGGDLRHLGLTAAVIQDLGRRPFVGFRFDRYDPDLDFLDDRRGMLIPTDASITTLSPLVGVRLPWRARVTAQYDAIFDTLTRDDRGVPTDLRNDRWTARLQVEL
jgi:hypothetical protein